MWWLLLYQWCKCHMCNSWENKLLLLLLWDVKSYVWVSNGPRSYSNVWDRCTVAKSYGWDVKSSVGVNSSWLCHTEELISPTYEIATYTLCHTEELVSRTYEIVILFAMSYGWDVKSYVWHSNSPMSYGRDSNSYVWDRCTVAMSYGWDVKSYVWLSNSGYVIWRS